MDANERYIPIVEDDQGEGFKDPVEFEELSDFQKKLAELQGDVPTPEENLERVIKQSQEKFRKQMGRK